MLIHIGYHKTGTTWLQQHVFNDPSKGFVSPWTLESGEAVEYFVLQHPLRYDPLEARRAFHRAYAGGEDLCPVISHEDLSGYPISGRFSSLGFNICDRIHQTFPEARVLICVREQKSMLLSLYREYVRADGEGSIEEFLGTGAEKPGYPAVCRLDRLEYHFLVKRYFDLFGRDKVLVMPYEFLHADATAFEQQIHDFCGTGIVAEQVLKPRNVGWLGATLAVRRKLNRFVHMPPTWDGRWQRRPRLHRLSFRLCETFDRLVPRYFHRAIDERHKRFIAERVEGYYAESNRQLAKLLGMDLKRLGYEMPTSVVADEPRAQSFPQPQANTKTALRRSAKRRDKQSAESQHIGGRLQNRRRGERHSAARRVVQAFGAAARNHIAGSRISSLDSPPFSDLRQPVRRFRCTQFAAAR